MKTRHLGEERFQASVLGLRRMGMSFAYGGAEESQAINTIHAVTSMGVTSLDPAEVYGPFDNKVLVGKAIRDIRDKVRIAAKFDFRISSIGQGSEHMADVDSCPEYICESMEGSLKRLNIEATDLFYQHRVDPTVPVEDVVGTVADLVKEGKICRIGLSGTLTQTLRRACKVCPIITVQTEYPLWTREPEVDILSTCREPGVGLVPYSPLGRDFLTGKITDPGVFVGDDFRRNLPCLQTEVMRRNQLLFERLQQMATRYDATLMQTVLAWVMSKGENIVPIPGAGKIAYLRDNAGAANIILSPEDILTIEDTFTPDNVTDLRYNQGDFNLIEKQLPEYYSPAVPAGDGVTHDYHCFPFGGIACGSLCTSRELI